MKLFLSLFAILFKMLFSLRNFFHVNRRFHAHVSCSSSPLFRNQSPFSYNLPSQTSLMSCPFVWFTSFLCLIRYPFVSKSGSISYCEDLDRDWIRKVVQQDLWGDPKMEKLFDSSLAPIWATRVLVELKEDPRLAFKFFKQARTRSWFQHTTESYCIIAHILFCARMYSDANSILKEMILSRAGFPGCDSFDVLWSTRNVCAPGFGVFDALFSVLIDLGMLEEACQCFSKMKRFRVFPKTRSCNGLLHRFAKLGKTDETRKFFKDMIGAGITPSVFTYNIMIDYMCKEGDLEAAIGLFEQMKHRGLIPDTVTYNSLIDGYGKVGLLEDVVYLFEEMKSMGCEPDVITYNALINCFCKFERMPKAFEFYSEMKHSGLKPNVVTYSTLIDAFCKEGMMHQAIKFFIDMRRVGLLPNEFTYTSLIDANCKAGHLADALKLAKEMLQANVELNVVTYTALIDGLCDEEKMKEAEEVFSAMLKAGVIPNLQIYTALIHGLVKVKNLERALEILNEMKGKGITPDLLMYGTIVWGLCNQEKVEEAELVMTEMRELGIRANPVIYTTLMDSYFKSGKPTEGLHLLEEMQNLSIEVTAVTFCVLIDGLCKNNLVSKAINYFERIRYFGLQPNVAIYTAIIDGLCKDDRIEAAKALFEEMVEEGLVPDTTAYTSLLDGNLKHGNFQEALALWEKMAETGMELDLHAYTSMVWGLAQCNQLQRAREFLEEMITKGIIPEEVLCIGVLKKYYELDFIDEGVQLQKYLMENGILDGDFKYAVPNIQTPEVKPTGSFLVFSPPSAHDKLRYGFRLGSTLSPPPLYLAEMGARVPVQHYNLRSADSFIGSSLHDLNTVDGPPGDIDGIGGAVGRDGVDGDGLDNAGNSASVECMHESYRNAIQIHNVGVEEGRTSMENDGSAGAVYPILTTEDVSPIESARARFLQIIVDYFISHHVIEVTENEVDYVTDSGREKVKRKTNDTQYQGDPRYALPLMYVANLYETLVNEANERLASLNGIREKTIGVALEAAGGLYRKLTKKFPKKGTCTYRRRELATSLETRTRFPELVIQEEKRVRFVVVNGLDIVEKPENMPAEDAEWFKRLTARTEVAVSARDYKFYCPRHKHRRIPNSMSNIPGLPSFPGIDSSAMANPKGFRSVGDDQSQQQTPSKHHMSQMSHQPQFHQTIHQSHHHSIHQGGQHTAHYSQDHPSNMPEMAHTHQSPSISQHMDCLQPLTGGHITTGRLHIMPNSPAKFCDECGAQYLRETSKFCSECGSKRLGI
ncbi:PREDICTED: putative pentatricopeptide repeat-containing protein At2g02150 [Tarenaya hassleriana]|uniref:putative pentatricopeptide repeat-containing protein At2g02150 n=1 Tax=Tarenaya hassleriana TaxID=28532 RepID=UPI00053C6AA2|nr:PREDICTED: putative pentatricopeptide repeat-containing protein At2g02150 [Tarenaya hassleriana]